MPTAMRNGRRRRRPAVDGSPPPSWPAAGWSVSVRSRMSANPLRLLPVDLLELLVVDLGREPVEDQLPLLEGDGSIRVPVDEVEEVERAEHGHPVLLVDRLQVTHDRVRQNRVEAGDRLVGQ